jgi:molybdate transport system ATP-binding protein
MIDIEFSRQLFGSEGKMHLQTTCHINKGELVGLYGPSGAGKSSILRMLAGLMKPESGKLTVEGETWFDSREKINLKPQKRNIGMVFQEYSLFPNMTVRENLVFALNSDQNRQIVDDLLEMIGLDKLAHKRPALLSGGQKQRVALARAMVRKPKLLLLDEPLSALDMEMRANLQQYIVQFHRNFELTTLLVSHDASEIQRMAKRVLVLEKGCFTYDGDPSKFFG